MNKNKHELVQVVKIVINSWNKIEKKVKMSTFK